jgi:N-acyl-D-aspartate/D-glutamate deacylase
VLDVIVRGGTVVDGTGQPGRRADIGISDSRIVAIGDVKDRARSVIDAEGKIVAPGFVDVHTHYDAQVFWDPTLSPSPLHGVTTVVGGNCGFSVAPLTPGDVYLMRMLARVEGMPLAALQQGVAWDWESTAGYLDRIEGTLAVNAGFLVGHSAIRRAVMGDDATRGPSSPEEMEAMMALYRRGIEAGGLGFSSSWARTHNDAEGDMVPSRHATKDELVAFCQVTGEYPGTSIEFIPCVGPFQNEQMDLMAEMSATANRHLNWNVLVVTGHNGAEVQAKLAAADHARKRGGKVVALTLPMALRLRLSFLSGFALDALPGWESAMALPGSEKLEVLANPITRGRLAEQADQPGPMRHLAEWSDMTIVETFSEQTRACQGQTVRELAARQGKDPFDTLVDIVVADRLQTGFSPPVDGDGDRDWEARVAVWRDGRAVIGASDAGAHLDLFASFNYPTEMLDQAVGRRQLLPLEEAVHLITDVPARLYGLKERGRLAEGWQADVVVFDPTTVRSGPVYSRRDVPGGAARVYAEAEGIEHVLVNGEEILTRGTFTDARPGTVLRSGRDTETVPARA